MERKSEDIPLLVAQEGLLNGQRWALRNRLIIGRDAACDIVVADRQVVVSPAWSIHYATATRRYTFCWAMGGENQTFDDMDGVQVTALR